MIQEYWNDGFIYNLKSRIKHRTLKGERIIIDMELKEVVHAWWNGHAMERTTDQVIDRSDRWTDINPENLQRAGYKRVYGLYDSIVWWKVPVYMRIHNAHKFDVRHATDADGILIYSQDTSATLHDAMQSNATQDFIKGMGKTSIASMDLQKILMIGILAVGAFFGMYMLGVF